MVIRLYLSSPLFGVSKPAPGPVVAITSPRLPQGPLLVCRRQLGGGTGRCPGV